MNPAGTVRRFWIVFHGGPRPTSGTAFFAYRLVRHDFRHCFAILESGRQALILNVLWNGIWIDYDEEGVAVVLERARAAGFRVVEIVTTFPEREIWPGAVFYYCVPFLKALLGISDFRVWTPFQLYRKLLALGGREVNLCPAASAS